MLQRAIGWAAFRGHVQALSRGTRIFSAWKQGCVDVERQGASFAEEKSWLVRSAFKEPQSGWGADCARGYGSRAAQFNPFTFVCANQYFFERGTACGTRVT